MSDLERSWKARERELMNRVAALEMEVAITKERTMESKTLPATPPKGKTEINKIFEALGLMNSMIIGGEQHSSVSITLYEEAMQNLAALESSLTRAQERLRKISMFADLWITRDAGLLGPGYSLTQEELDVWKDVWRLATEEAKPSPEREEK